MFHMFLYREVDCFTNFDAIGRHVIYYGSIVQLLIIWVLP